MHRGQSAEAVIPSPLLNRPAAQLEHAAALEVCALPVLYVPAGHFRQLPEVDAPACVVYVPDVQAVHVAPPAAPVAVLYRPLAHGVQFPWEMNPVPVLYVPAVQFVHWAEGLDEL